MKCRHCQSDLAHSFMDLGFAPPSNAYLSKPALSEPETYYPLRVKICDACWLVQTEDYARSDELFSADYAYFSSTSAGWLAHAARYVDMISGKLSLGPESLVVELASNDGYLLKNFVAMGVPCLGIEPTASTAAAAEALGIPVLREFFGQSLAQHLATHARKADLVIGNNVYAHVPDINDFTHGLKTILKDGGTITLEFPHLLQLMINTQFDTIYHEHFSYFSLQTVQLIFKAAGLRVFDVEQLPTHGGSLRIYGCHFADRRSDTSAVADMIAQEQRHGLADPAHYAAFQKNAETIKNALLRFLIDKKREGAAVAAYGAAAKGNTLLNFAGIKPDLLPYVCDAAPSKQGKYMPGSHIPIVSPDVLKLEKPDFILILPWNIKDEVMEKTKHLVSPTTRYVVAVPELTIL
jgi:SAM-dependent methyltransferase